MGKMGKKWTIGREFDGVDKCGKRKGKTGWEFNSVDNHEEKKKGIDGKDFDDVVEEYIQRKRRMGRNFDTDDSRK